MSYKPNQVVIESLGIGLSEATNDSLNLTGTQRLIVGESIINTGGTVVKSYGLVVDEQGVAVNTSLPNRAAYSNEFALFVEGNLHVRGNITATGSTTASNAAAGSNYWIRGATANNGIYYPGKITIGNYGNFIAASSNTHALNIVESADRSIENAQISVQNTQGGEFRAGILGTAAASPAIINTRSGTPLEFHVARDQNYFTTRYRNIQYIDGVLTSNATDIPIYDDRTSNAPHLLIDTAGNVGIHTSAVPSVTYEQVPERMTLGGATFPYVTEAPPLFIDGTLYASNIVTYDYQTGSNASIDHLYVRRLGTTLLANQIIPGQFADGYYLFQSNISIGNSTDVIDPEYDLTVYGKARIRDRFKVDGISELNFVTINDTILLDVASFCNDVYVNRDVIVKESIRLRGGFFTELPEGSNLTWCNVQFTVASPSFSNINLLGAGITTPGRLGVGIDPRYDEVNNQCVIRKRSADIFELELYDLSDGARLHKGAYIGHPATAATRVNDGSLVIATPSSYDPDFNLVYNTGAPQNVYFYPGRINLRDTTPIIRDDNPPTLNITATDRVGIRTFTPITQFDLRGNMAYTGRIYKTTTQTTQINNETPIIGEWLEQVYANIYPSGGAPATFRGIEYLNSNAPHVGVHVAPDPRYGMIVGNGLKIADDLYTTEDYKVGFWIDGNNACNINAADVTGAWHPIFTAASVGIGVTQPASILDIKNPRPGPTRMRLIRSDTDPTTYFEMGNVATPWSLRTNDADVFSTYYGATRVMFSRGSQVVVGETLDVFTNTSNTRPTARFTVDGDASILGSMYVTGGYYAGGSFVVNTNCNINVTPPINQDDVFIGGQRVFIVPTQGMMVNYTQDLINSEVGDTTPFRVYQPNTAVTTIARFRGAGNNALVEVTNRFNDAFRFGIIEQNSTASFAFLDKYNQPYLSFSSNTVAGEKYFAFNTVVGAPTASLHVQNATVGSNMVKLTRYGQGSDLMGYAPELEFQRIINGPPVTDRAWILRGPDSTFNEKFSINYRSTATGARTELYTFTNNGCIGIGNTQPEFAVDIQGTGKQGSLRMLNTGADPTPQLIFQSGVTTYGADSLNDYRMYSACNQFFLDVQNSTSYYKLLHFNQYGNLGVLTNPNQNYTMNVAGYLNVESGIYLNDFPLFTTQGTANESGVNISAKNIFLSPRTVDNGGVVINPQLDGSGNAIPTSNIFHLRGDQGPNLAVFEATAANEAQIHLKTTQTAGFPVTRAIGRFALSNQSFVWSVQSNASNTAYISGSAAGYTRLASLDLATGLTLGSNMPLAFASGPAFVPRGSNLGLAGSYFAIGDGVTNPAATLHIARGPAQAPAVATLQVDNSFAVYSNVVVSHIPLSTSNIYSTGSLNLNDKIYLTQNNIFLGDDLIPNVTELYDLGSASNRWRDIYLSGNSVDLGGTKIQRDALSGDLSFTEADGGALRGLRASNVNIADVVTVLPGAPIIFATTSNGVTTRYRPLLIDEGAAGTGAGGIGIGTDTPLAPLHVVGASNDLRPAAIIDHSPGTSNPLIFVVSSNTVPKFYIDGAGSGYFAEPLVVNNTSVVGQATFYENVYMSSNLDVAGDITSRGNVVTTSDIRLKSDLRKIDNALEKVKALTGYTFIKQGSKYRDTGLIAQEVAAVLPEAVIHNGSPEAPIYVAYGNMMGLIIEAIKSLDEKMTILASKLA